MPAQDEIFPLPSSKAEVTDFLKNRRSNLAKLMGGPGPNAEQLDELLMIAARVPDHRKLAPWRFVLFQGEARSDFGKHIASAFQKSNPDMPQDRIDFEAQRLLRAPLVIGVISSPKACPRGTPEWEQVLSSGAVCYNLCLAAQASGFGAQWLTEWYSYDADVQKAMGLSTTEKISGFIYIGTPQAPSKERPRPDMPSLITHWSS